LKQECREKREDAIDDLRSVLDGRLETIQVWERGEKDKRIRNSEA
jgi:hypothetical protein